MHSHWSSLITQHDSFLETDKKIVPKKTLFYMIYFMLNERIIWYPTQNKLNNEKLINISRWTNKNLRMYDVAVVVYSNFHIK